VGHSGVGKSSLVNALHPGADLAVGPGRERDGKGRHTTSSSSTWEGPDGTILIDTPGVREFATTALSRAGLAEQFPDVVELASRCRFRDCGHGGDAGCAVQAALESGELESRRWRDYLALRDEDG
jgi:ribosome biogenesis GTPase